MSTEQVTTPLTFLDTLEPALQFIAPEAEIDIPKGLLSCCRVQHQPGCDHHVARSLVGAATKRRWPDGREEEWIHPAPVMVEGDVLAMPTELFTAVKAHWMMARATAKSLGVAVYEMQVGVFLLNITQAAQYDEIMQDYREKLSAYHVAMNGLTPEQIAALPVEVVEDEDDIGPLLESQFVPVEMYAANTLIYPTEIGHNDRARYVTSAVWQAPDREAMVWQPDPDPFPKQEPAS